MSVGLFPVAVVDLMSLLLAPVTRPQQIESGGAMDIGSRLELFRFEGPVYSLQLAVLGSSFDVSGEECE